MVKKILVEEEPLGGLPEIFQILVDQKTPELNCNP